MINPLQTILERLEYSDPAKASIFPWDEVKTWPSGALARLVASGLLQHAQPAAVIECDGCEENCAMPVTIYPSRENRPGKAFITCDRRDDIGRVPVDFVRLRQWQSTIDAVCRFIATGLGLRRSEKSIASDKLWEIGIATGNKRSQMLCLQAYGALFLVAGGNKIPLADLIEHRDGEYRLNEGLIRDLIDAATTGDSRYTPTQTRREARKLDTLAMYESWRKEYGALKGRRPNMSDVWYSKQIAKMEIALGRNFSTIKKHIKS